MRARLSTLKTGAPLMRNTKPVACASPRPFRTWAKPLRTASMARSCASRSAPAALLMATSNARGCCAASSRDTHTPCSLRGALLGISASPMRSVSPVGSRSKIGFTAWPAGVPSRASDSCSPWRNPWAVKRCASTAGLST